MLKFGYKVVSTLNTGKKRSAVAQNSLVYELNTPTHEVKGRPLFVFDTLENAKEFIGNYGWKYEIYKCIYTESTTKLKQIASSTYELEEFYADPDSVITKPAPLGTIFASSIVLLERVS